jgi:glycosyltransferase involved in cell wall biosynthesis
MFVVSPQMGPMLKEYLKIAIDPAVVANDPISQGRRESARALRTDAGIAEGVPLMVYSGAVAPQRGLGTVLDALSSLPGVALVIIAPPNNVYVRELMARAASIGISDRVKNVAYVPNEELVSYLSAADIGLIPILHRPNHEISLITKFGEYAAANLPIIVSDVKTMAEEVRTIGNGEVFTAENAAEFVVATERILADPAKYRAAYTDEVLRTRSWERQSETLIATYNGLVSDRAVEVKPSTPLPFTLTKPHSLSGPNDARSATA